MKVRHTPARAANSVAALPAPVAPTMSPIEQVRADIAKLCDERDLTLRAPRCHAETVAAIAATCEAAAAVIEPRINFALSTMTFGGVFGDGLHIRPSGDGRLDILPALAAVLGPEVLAAALVARLGEMPEGLNVADRAERLAALDAEILALSHVEETAILQSELERRPVSRRPNADPRCVLRVAAP